MSKSDSNTTATEVTARPIYELPWRSETGARVFAELASDGELQALHTGDDLPGWISAALDHPVLQLGDLAPTAPAPLGRGVHLAPFTEGGATVVVAIDAEGRCRDRAPVPGRTARATDATMSRLWGAIS